MLQCYRCSHHPLLTHDISICHRLCAKCTAMYKPLCTNYTQTQGRLQSLQTIWGGGLGRGSNGGGEGGRLGARTKEQNHTYTEDILLHSVTTAYQYAPTHAHQVPMSTCFSI